MKSSATAAVVDLIKDLRATRGLKPIELADKAGIAQSTLWRIENDDSAGFGTDTMFRLLSALGATVVIKCGNEELEIS